MDLILILAKHYMIRAHISGLGKQAVTHWLGHEHLDSRESLHPELCQVLYHRCSMLGLYLLDSSFNNKLDRNVTRTRDPQTFTVDALVTQ